MPKSTAVDFRQTWQIVSELAGQTFVTDQGQQFTFIFKRTFVVVEPGAVSIPRTNFEKVLRDASGGAVQGSRFIKAIYRHANFQPSGG